MLVGLAQGSLHGAAQDVPAGYPLVAVIERMLDLGPAGRRVRVAEACERTIGVVSPPA